MSKLALRSETFALLRQLEEADALTPTSLDLSSQPDLPFETYEALGALLGRLNSGSRFWLGDWLSFGETAYGERYAQAAEVTGLAPQSLANIQSVCHRVPPSRRRPGVSFSCHAEVAALDPNAQRHWLAQAEKRALTKAELRSEIQSEGDVLPPVGETCPTCGQRLP